MFSDELNCSGNWTLYRAARLNGAVLAGVVLALGLPGCVVGPDFKPPAAPPTTHYTSPDEVSAPDGDAGAAAPRQTLELGEKVAVDWWTLFQSPDLDQLVKQAVAGSHTLESAKARLAQAREAIAAKQESAVPAVMGGNALRLYRPETRHIHA